MVQALYASLDALAAAVSGQPDPAWVAKMVHRLPDAPSVERVPWLLARCRDKTVVHFGATGPLHGQLRQVCRTLYGVDKEPVEGCVQVDLDWQPDALPHFEGVEILLLAEVIEHLVGANWLLKFLREEYPDVPLIITTPNMLAPQPRLKDGIIVVNRDHNLWFCAQTLHVFLRKCGYTITEFYWYGQPTPPRSEGMIAVAQSLCIGDAVLTDLQPSNRPLALCGPQPGPQQVM
jgi:hypothetical protein